MKAEQRTQYDGFAADYDWVFSDPRATNDRRAEALTPILELLPADPAVLDCACGTGLLALALARRGYRLRASDASAEMIAQAQRHAAEEGIDIAFTVCAWEQLARTYRERFDLAICCGNSIGHCRDEDEMLRSLRGIRAVLNKGSWLVLDSRNWERSLTERIRFSTLGLRVRDGKRCIPVFVQTFPKRNGDALVIEVLLVFEQHGDVQLKSYPITYYPFRVKELIERLESSGFSEVETDCARAAEGYQVVARAA